MKSKVYAIIMFDSVILLSMQGKAMEHKNKMTKQSQGQNLCYCSDKCGPRKVKRGDTPFFDEEHGLCFCKQRDKENYKQNRCDKKPKKEFTSVCDPK